MNGIRSATLALIDPAGELDIDLVAVIEGAQRLPRRSIAGDGVAETNRLNRQIGGNRLGGVGLGVLTAQGGELILRIGPGQGRHCRLFGTIHLQMVGAPIGGDDQIGLEARGERLDQHMHPLTIAGTAQGVADHPAHGVASRNSGEFFARFKGDVAHPLRRGVELIERPFAEGVNLDGVDVAVFGRLQGGRPIGGVHPRGGWTGIRFDLAGRRLKLARQRQHRGNFDDLYGHRWGGLDRRRFKILPVIGDLRRWIGDRAGRKRQSGSGGDQGGE